MEPQARAITWEAPEHYYQERGKDWYFILTILIVALGISSLLFNNVLFALLIFVSGGTLALASLKRPSIIPYGISVRGIRIDEDLYPFTTLSAYHIDEEDPRGPQLMILTKKRFTPLIVIPLPKEYIDDVEDIVRDRLEEKFLEEPAFFKIIERFGL
jgi:hypothetical protein